MRLLIVWVHVLAAVVWVGGMVFILGLSILIHPCGKQSCPLLFGRFPSNRSR